MTEPQATVIAALIAIAPVLLIVILVALVAVVNRRSLQGVFQRATKVGVAGVFELELDTQSIKEAREDAPLSDQQASALDRRVGRSQAIITGCRLLWVDDQPENNRAERRYLRSAGLWIVNVRSTDEALIELAKFDFDVVVTDMARPEGQKAGSDLVAAMRAGRFEQPVVAYVGLDESAGVPPGFFGLTDRPDELVNLLLDALERQGTSSS